MGTYISIITLNVSGLNSPTKRHKLAEWMQKEGPYICCLQETHFKPKRHRLAERMQKQDLCVCCLQETHFRSKDTYRLKVRGWKIYSMQIEIKRQLE